MDRVVRLWAKIWLRPSDSQIRFYPIGFCNIGLHKKTGPFIWSKSKSLKLEFGSQKELPYFDVTLWWYRVDVVPILPMCPVRGHVLPNFPKCPVPVLMLYRTYRSVRYRYYLPNSPKCPALLYRNYLSGMKLCNRTSGTGIHVVRNLPKCPGTGIDVVPKFSYRSVRYRYWCGSELTEVSGTSNTGGVYRWYASVRTVPNTPLKHFVPYV